MKCEESWKSEDERRSKKKMFARPEFQTKTLELFLFFLEELLVVDFVDAFFIYNASFFIHLFVAPKAAKLYIVNPL
jgi:hypothetical protein